ncbi:MAG: hypothetical protein ACYCX3_15505 [Thermoleophilia bacterium]
MTDGRDSIFKGVANQAGDQVLRCSALTERQINGEVDAAAPATRAERMALAFVCGDTEAADYFGRSLGRITKDGFVIALVPPRSVGAGPSELLLRCVHVLAEGGGVDAADCLVRVDSGPSHDEGVEGAARVHYASVRVRFPELVAGRQVMLLDGVALAADAHRGCRDRLLEAGAASVCCVAIVGVSRGEWDESGIDSACEMGTSKSTPPLALAEVDLPDRSSVGPPVVSATVTPVPSGRGVHGTAKQRSFKPGHTVSKGERAGKPDSARQGPAIRRGATRRTVVDDDPSSYFERLQKYGPTGGDE